MLLTMTPALVCLVGQTPAAAACGSAADAAANANTESVYRAVVASCANHGIPVSTVIGTWEGQNEHCGTAASIAAGTGGTAAEHTISVDSSTSTKSSSQALAPSMLLAVALAFIAM